METVVTSSGHAWQEDVICLGELMEAPDDPFRGDDPGATLPTLSYRIEVKTRGGAARRLLRSFADYTDAAESARRLVEEFCQEASIFLGETALAVYLWLPEREMVALLCSRCGR